MNSKLAKRLRRNAESTSWVEYRKVLSEEEWGNLTDVIVNTTTYNYNRVGTSRSIQVTLSPPCPRFFYQTEKKAVKHIKHVV